MDSQLPLTVLLYIEVIELDYNADIFPNITCNQRMTWLSPNQSLLSKNVRSLFCSFVTDSRTRLLPVYKQVSSAVVVKQKNQLSLLHAHQAHFHS